MIGIRQPTSKRKGVGPSFVAGSLVGLKNRLILFQHLRHMVKKMPTAKTSTKAHRKPWANKGSVVNGVQMFRLRKSNTGLSASPTNTNPSFVKRER